MTAKREAKRIHAPMPPELIEKIDDYRFAHRLPSRAEAMRQLIELGLLHAPKPPRQS